MFSTFLPWAGAITGAILTIVALARCHGLWRPKHIVGALTLLTLLTLIFLAYKGGSMDYQQRFDVPLTYQQAVSEEKIDFPFPASSRQIYSASYADWQVAGMFVRFEAPVEECLSHLEKVKAWFNSRHGSRMIWEKDAINSSSLPTTTLRETRIGPLPWFDVHHIRNGIHLHAPSDLAIPPEMWVDLDNGFFYYWWTR